MSISGNLKEYKNKLSAYHAHLVAVSKTKPQSAILEAYEEGQRIFGENKVQDLVEKAIALPNDISWHMIGHLQRNKVKLLLPYVDLIHAVDSLRLLKEIEKQAAKINKIVACLLQIHIAKEEQKFGFTEEELEGLIEEGAFKNFKHLKIKGLMGMATHTDNVGVIKKEFEGLSNFQNRLKAKTKEEAIFELKELSIGMSGDYEIALEAGATLVRIGTAIFGKRNY